MTPPPRMPVGAMRQMARVMRRQVFNSSQPWETQRQRFNRMIDRSAVPSGVERAQLEVAGVPVERLVPAGVDPRGSLVHLHGGGFTIGSPAAARTWAGALAKALSIEVLLPDYRLAPEDPFPAAIDDAAAVIDHVLSIRPAQRVVVSGDSAGGNLALGDAQRRVAQGSDTPAALVLISPWLDLSTDRLADAELLRRDPMLSPEWLAAAAVAYAPGQLRDPAVSPLLGSLEGLPPILIEGGSDDILAPDAARLAQALDVAGDVSLTIGPGLFHDFPLFVGQLKAADDALEVTIEHLTRTLDLDS